MNTRPTVSRYADREKITVQPNTRAKVEEEGDSYEFSRISPGHHACTHGKNTHVIIDKDGKIGCSCENMTYRCTGNTVCKHIAAFLDLNVPPQIPASVELIKKLMLMGWVGGKDDLHPAELLDPAQNNTSEHPAPSPATVVCPHCKTRAKRNKQEEADAWLANHLTKCRKNPGNNAPTGDSTGNDVTVDETEVPITPKEPPNTIPAKNVPDQPEICPDEASSALDEDGADTGDEPLLPSNPTEVPTNLAAALCNMQKTELFAVNDSENPFFKSMYADLASIWTAIRKPLTDNGLAIIQSTENFDGGITVITKLMHTSGESIETRLSAKLDKQTLQGLGSAMTYLRRYSLASLVGVASVDDDAESAMKR